MRDELFQILMDVALKTGINLDYLISVTNESLSNEEAQELGKDLISSGGKSPRRARKRKSKVVP